MSLCLVREARITPQHQRIVHFCALKYRHCFPTWIDVEDLEQHLYENMVRHVYILDYPNSAFTNACKHALFLLMRQVWHTASIDAMRTMQSEQRQSSGSEEYEYVHAAAPALQWYDNQDGRLVFEKVLTIVNRLKPRQRQAFRLLCEGWPVREVATMLGAHEMAVHRMRKKWRPWCEDATRHTVIDTKLRARLRALSAQGLSYAEAGRLVGLGRRTVRNVIKGRRRAHDHC